MGVKDYGGVKYQISILNPSKATKEILSIISEVKEKGFSTAQPISIGSVEYEIIEFAKNNNIDLKSKYIIVTPSKILHTIRELKVASGKAVSEQHFAEFPLRRRMMEIYYDSTKGNFLYYDRSRQEKFVIHPNYELKVKKAEGVRGAKNGKIRVVNYITASKTNDQEFTLSKLTRIK